MCRIERKTFGRHEVLDDSGSVLYETWEQADAERFLFELNADEQRREAEDAAGRVFGL